jgi:drug/metabolite transporter (DMT)-like permease
MDTTVRIGDGLVIFGAFFLEHTYNFYRHDHVKRFNYPLTIGAIQTFIVAILSLVIAIIFEELILENILKEKIEILYAGILSGGLAFVLQIYAQKNITPAPAAIIFSLEGVFCNYSCVVFVKSNFGY